MVVEKVDTLVVGAGQAGIAASEHLTNHGIQHVVVERDRIAEKWRSARWDSLVSNGPAWHDRFPSRNFDDPNHDAFISKEDVASYFIDYVEQIKAPVRCGINVEHVTRIPGGAGFHVTTSAGNFEARHIIAATGAFQDPVIPPLIPKYAPIHQMHSNEYRNPGQLPEGAVLVIGAGSSGAQISEELMNSGRKVYLSVGAHDRPPRRYRGRDFVWWLGVLGKWDMQTPALGSEHVTIAVSGADGGKTVDFRRFAFGGIHLVGMADKYEKNTFYFADDLAKNIKKGDINHLGLLDEADAYVQSHNLNLPIDLEERKRWPDPDCLTSPTRKLNLSKAGITTVM